MMAVRLQKVLAQAGVASRRASEEIILAGRVSVNGRIINIPGSQVEPGDDIRVDGRMIYDRERRRYLMVHKPAGYVTTLHDPQGRPTVKGLVSSLPERLYPVGRLDYDSEGLLLMTNDGDFAYHLQHPRFGVPKIYQIKVEGRISSSDVRTLGAGIKLQDGLFKPVNVRLDKLNRQSSWLRLTISEGRNRVIRRAFDLLGYSVRRLIRLEIGGVNLGDLKKGEFRDLTLSEMETLTIFFKKLS
jgi:23S rRNA pseudouridine2605 synthase